MNYSVAEFMPQTIEAILTQDIVLDKKSLEDFKQSIEEVERDLKDNPTHASAVANSFYLDKLDWWEDALQLVDAVEKIPQEILDKASFIFSQSTPKHYLFSLPFSERKNISRETVREFFSGGFLKGADIYFFLRFRNIYDILKER